MRNLFAFILIVLVTSSCYDDHSEVIPVQDFISEEILAKIRANGQPIFNGLTPPRIEGRFKASPLILVSSNFDDSYEAGYVFDDMEVEFTKFDQSTLTLEVNLKQGGSIGEGYGSFISGNENNFTIYVKVESIDSEGVKWITTMVFSGRMGDNGISDLYTSLFMIDDGGDPNNDKIEVGQGRLVIDGDGFSPRIY